MKPFVQDQLVAAIDRTVTMVRDMMAYVHPLELGMRAVSIKGGQEQLISLRLNSVDRNWEAVRQAATKERWDCCVMIYEAWISDQSAPSQAANREEVIIFHAEGRGCRPIMRQFAIDRMPDGTIRLGKERLMAEVNYFSRLGPLFSAPQNN